MSEDQDTSQAAPEAAAPREDKDPTKRQEIRFRRRGNLAEIILTRPTARNALSRPMIRQMDAYLAAWAENPAVRAVVVSGDSSAFCAGGDVRSVWEAARGGDSLTRLMFRDEYTLNRRIRKFPKPYVALADGLVMGGGLGISVHGDLRIVGDSTVMAMPEMRLGFFTDVGTSYALSRLPGQLGRFLALTGYRMNAADALYTGLGTHYVPSERLFEIPDFFVGGTWGADPLADVTRRIEAVAAEPGPAPLAEHREAIDRCFAGESIEAIRDALAAEGGDWAQATLAELDRGSPTSLKVTLAALNRAASLDFDAALSLEFRLSQAFVAGHDFHEGVRAVLVDKDQAPQWRPARLDEIDAASVESYFAPPPGGDLAFD